MRTTQFVVDGLGHLSTLLVDDASGTAAVVDPRRDVDVYLDAARAADARITLVVETHLHNDYVSGGRELAALTGATQLIGAGAQLEHEHRGVRNGTSVALGGLRLTALDTPGHTPEHVAWTVTDPSRSDEPVLLFSGGSLLVGAVGRTDLLGQEHALPYAHDQFRSLHEVLLRQPDGTIVHPTHGGGSLCSTGIGSTPWTTIGYERRHNPMLQPTDVDEFARVLLDGQPAFPRYFARMRPINRAGPPLTGGRVPPPRPLGLDEARDALRGDAQLVDLRPAAAWAAGHVPGSLSVPAGSSFGTWLGWVGDPDRPLVLMLDDPADWDDAARQLLRIGFDRVAGHLRGGYRTWADAGLPVEAGGSLTAVELARRVARGDEAAPLVIDVRQPGEFASGHVPGAIHIGAGDLPDRLAELPRDRPLATMCASGYRSGVAASLLRRAGFREVSWVTDGIAAWKAAGGEVERGGGEAGAEGSGEADGHRH